MHMTYRNVSYELMLVISSQVSMAFKKQIDEERRATRGKLLSIFFTSATVEGCITC